MVIKFDPLPGARKDDTGNCKGVSLLLEDVSGELLAKTDDGSLMRNNSHLITARIRFWFQRTIGAKFKWQEPQPAKLFVRAHDAVLFQSTETEKRERDDAKGAVMRRSPKKLKMMKVLESKGVSIVRNASMRDGDHGAGLKSQADVMAELEANPFSK